MEVLPICKWHYVWNTPHFYFKNMQQHPPHLVKHVLPFIFALALFLAWNGKAKVHVHVWAGELK